MRPLLYGGLLPAKDSPLRRPLADLTAMLDPPAPQRRDLDTLTRLDAEGSSARNLFDLRSGGGLALRSAGMTANRAGGAGSFLEFENLGLADIDLGRWSYLAHRPDEDLPAGGKPSAIPLSGILTGGARRSVEVAALAGTLPVDVQLSNDAGFAFALRIGGPGGSFSSEKGALSLEEATRLSFLGTYDGLILWGPGEIPSGAGLGFGQRHSPRSPEPLRADRQSGG